jgi:predicted nuclease of predicted toxin-antitoxin system
MKILVDQNISFRIIQKVASVFPEITHVKSLDLINASDYRIFTTAKQASFHAIMTQDEDFYSLLLEHGAPPKVIWLKTGNCSTSFLAEVVLRNAQAIRQFIEDDIQDCLELYG